MKTRSPLVLMEQLIMVTVFALTAAICLRMFVLSDQISRRSSAVDRAVLEAQTIAEQIKHDPDLFPSDRLWCYDKNWSLLPPGENAVYSLQVTHETSDDPALWLVSVTVFTADGETLLTLPVSGQLGKEADRRA